MRRAFHTRMMQASSRQIPRLMCMLPSLQKYAEVVPIAFSCPVAKRRFFDDSFNVSSGLEGRCSEFMVTSLARFTNHEQTL